MTPNFDRLIQEQFPFKKKVADPADVKQPWHVRMRRNLRASRMVPNAVKPLFQTRKADKMEYRELNRRQNLLKQRIRDFERREAEDPSASRRRATRQKPTPVMPKPTRK